jgi:type I restriction enzyme S subunit
MRLRLQDGDILFVRTNGNPDYVGRCAVFAREFITSSGYDPHEFVFASYLIRARPDRGKVNPDYLQTYLTSTSARRALKERSRTSAGQYNINIEGLRSIPLMLPLLAEQSAFAEHLAQIQATIAQQERMAAAADQLVASLMARFFEG